MLPPCHLWEILYTNLFSIVLPHCNLREILYIRTILDSATTLSSLGNTVYKTILDSATNLSSLGNTVHKNYSLRCDHLVIVRKYCTQELLVIKIWLVTQNKIKIPLCSYEKESTHPAWEHKKSSSPNWDHILHTQIQLFFMKTAFLWYLLKMFASEV